MPLMIPSSPSRSFCRFDPPSPRPFAFWDGLMPGPSGCTSSTPTGSRCKSPDPESRRGSRSWTRSRKRRCGPAFGLRTSPRKAMRNSSGRTSPARRRGKCRDAPRLMRDASCEAPGWPGGAERDSGGIGGDPSPRPSADHLETYGRQNGGVRRPTPNESPRPSADHLETYGRQNGGVRKPSPNEIRARNSAGVITATVEATKPWTSRVMMVSSPASMAHAIYRLSSKSEPGMEWASSRAFPSTGTTSNEDRHSVTTHEALARSALRRTM